MLKGVQLYIALAVAALFLASVGANVYLGFRVSNLKETKTNLETARDQARENAKAHKESADKWEKEFNGLKETYDKLVEDTRKQSEQNETALANARAAERDANRTLDAFIDRYQAASRIPDC